MIVPPNHDVEVENHRLKLTKAGDETRPKPSVDRFFTSLAKEMGARSVGVILSGTGSDGSAGIRAIKNAGGITIVQDEASAKYTGMPNSALETGLVDWTLSAPEIANKVSEIVASDGDGQDDSEEDLQSGSPVPTQDLGPQLNEIMKLVHREMGSDFRQYKMPTLKRRLAKRMSAVGIENLEEYQALLNKDPAEVRALAQDFLVSVTSFFRDPDAFMALKPRLHAWIDRKPEGEEIRVWSAGCATGEEAYSLAMMIYSHVAGLDKHHHIKVFATDLDTEAISKARTAIYSERDLSDLPAGYLERFFERKGELFEIKKMIRDMVVIARQDLIQSPPFVKLDLICCRNVIIYFEPRLQQKIFEIFSYALRPNGLLFLGKSEAVQGAADLFELVDKRAKIFSKKATAVRRIPDGIRAPLPQIAFPPPLRRISGPTPLQLAQAQILERYGLAGAIVDAEGTIVTIIGNVSNFLRIPRVWIRLSFRP